MHIYKETHIKKDGIYYIDETTPLKLYIQAKVVLIDQTNTIDSIQRTIYIEKGGEAGIFGIMHNDKHYVLNIIHQWEEVVSDIGYVLLGTSKTHLYMNCLSRISSNNAKTNVHILSLVTEGSLEINGVVQIDQGLTGVEGHIEENNIFIGEKWSIKGIPSLLVRSDDVIASHSAKTERISEEKMFYIQSRGVDTQSSSNILVQSYISEVFSVLQKTNKDIFDTLVKRVFELLNK